MERQGRHKLDPSDTRILIVSQARYITQQDLRFIKKKKKRNVLEHSHVVCIEFYSQEDAIEVVSVGNQLKLPFHVYHTPRIPEILKHERKRLCSLGEAMDPTIFRISALNRLGFPPFFSDQKNWALSTYIPGWWELETNFNSLYNSVHLRLASVCAALSVVTLNDALSYAVQEIHGLESYADWDLLGFGPAEKFHGVIDKFGHDGQIGDRNYTVVDLFEDAKEWQMKIKYGRSNQSNLELKSSLLDFIRFKRQLTCNPAICIASWKHVCFHVGQFRSNSSFSFLRSQVDQLQYQYEAWDYLCHLIPVVSWEDAVGNIRKLLVETNDAIQIDPDSTKFWQFRHWFTFAEFICALFSGNAAGHPKLEQLRNLLQPLSNVSDAFGSTLSDAMVISLYALKNWFSDKGKLPKKDREASMARRQILGILLDTFEMTRNSEEKEAADNNQLPYNATPGNRNTQSSDMSRDSRASFIIPDSKICETLRTIADTLNRKINPMDTGISRLSRVEAVLCGRFGIVELALHNEKHLSFLSFLANFEQTDPELVAAVFGSASMHAAESVSVHDVTLANQRIPNLRQWLCDTWEGNAHLADDISKDNVVVRLQWMQQKLREEFPRINANLLDLLAHQPGILMELNTGNVNFSPIESSESDILAAISSGTAHMHQAMVTFLHSHATQKIDHASSPLCLIAKMEESGALASDMGSSAHLSEDDAIELYAILSAYPVCHSLGEAPLLQSWISRLGGVFSCIIALQFAQEVHYLDKCINEDHPSLFIYGESLSDWVRLPNPQLHSAETLQKMVVEFETHFVWEIAGVLLVLLQDNSGTPLDSVKKAILIALREMPNNGNGVGEILGVFLDVLSYWSVASRQRWGMEILLTPAGNEFRHLEASCVECARLSSQRSAVLQSLSDATGYLTWRNVSAQQEETNRKMKYNSDLSVVPVENRAFELLHEPSIAQSNGIEAEKALDQSVEESCIVDPNLPSLVECLATISEIRRKYGVDVQVGEKNAEVVSNYRETFINSMGHLSKNLYSSATHFVMEIIQNGDDNRYENGMVPAMCFEMDVNLRQITVRCNEIGFSEKDMISICHVGRSTKAGQAGYIGQKGIGWKSVFAVSDAPQIHSGNFHVQFDSETFVIPQILPAESSPAFSNEWRTSFVIPLKANQDIKSMCRELVEDISPQLLLFLKKLRRLDVVIKNDGRIDLIRSMTVSPGHVTSLKFSDGREWHESSLFVWKSTIANPEIKRGDVVVEETMVEIAFVLDEPSKNRYAYAFLPIRSYGLKCIVQADFLLTSARDNVSKYEAWNNFLRERLVSAYCEVFEYMRNELGETLIAEVPQSKSLLHRSLFYATLPLEDETLEYMKPFARDVMQRMCNMSVILDKQGVWRQPDSVVTMLHVSAMDISEFKSFVSHEEMTSYGLYFMDDDFAVRSGMSESGLRALGVHFFDAELVLDIADRKIEKGDMTPSWCEKMLLNFYKCYESISNRTMREKVRKRLQNIPLLPVLLDGCLEYVSCLKYKVCSLPLAGSHELSSVPYILREQQLVLLHPHLDMQNSLLNLVATELLDVHMLTMSYCLESLVLPALCVDKLPESLSNEELVSLGLLLAKNNVTFDSSHVDIWLLGSDLLPHRASSLRLHRKSSSLVSSLEEYLPESANIRPQISDKYREYDLWLTTVAGVASSLRVEKISRPDGADWQSTELQSLIHLLVELPETSNRARQKKVEAARLVLQLVCSTLKQEHLKRIRGDSFVDTSLIQSLKLFPWIPYVWKRKPSECKSLSVLLRPMYVSLCSSTDMYGPPLANNLEWIPLLNLDDLSLSIAESNMLQQLGLELLSKWKRTPLRLLCDIWDYDKNVLPMLHGISREFVIYMYGKALEDLRTNSSQESLEEWKNACRIFIPNEKQSNGVTVSGRFYPVKNVVWEDPALNITEHCQILRTMKSFYDIYHEMEGFAADVIVDARHFRTYFEVATVPSFSQHLDAIRYLREKDLVADTGKKHKFCIEVFRSWGDNYLRTMKKEGCMKEWWKEMLEALSAESFFICDNGCWHCPREVILVDNPELVAHISSARLESCGESPLQLHERFGFFTINHGKKNAAAQEGVEAVFDALEIPRLSRLVRCKTAAVGDRIEKQRNHHVLYKKLDASLRDVLDFVQQCNHQLKKESFVSKKDALLEKVFFCPDGCQAVWTLQVDSQTFRSESVNVPFFMDEIDGGLYLSPSWKPTDKAWCEFVVTLLGPEDYLEMIDLTQLQIFLLEKKSDHSNVVVPVTVSVADSASETEEELRIRERLVTGGEDSDVAVETDMGAWEKYESSLLSRSKNVGSISDKNENKASNPLSVVRNPDVLPNPFVIKTEMTTDVNVTSGIQSIAQESRSTVFILKNDGDHPEDASQQSTQKKEENRVAYPASGTVPNPFVMTGSNIDIDQLDDDVLADWVAAIDLPICGEAIPLETVIFDERDVVEPDGPSLPSRLAEMFIYQHLKRKYSHLSEEVSVIWVNEDKETHLPYDIKVVNVSSETLIEVKSTVSSSRALGNVRFHLSYSEFMVAVKNYGKYELYFVMLNDQSFLKIPLIDVLRNQQAQMIVSMNMNREK